MYSWSATGFPWLWQIPIEEPFQGNRHILDRGTVSPGPNDSGLVLEIADGVIRGFTRYWEHPLFEIAPEGFDLASCFVGVTATTSSSYQNYVLRGIRVETAPPPLRFIRGDVNASGEINIADGIVTLGFLFCLGCGEPPCQDAADTDDNGQINITDSVRVLNWLFLGGPAPPAPGPLACGTDPTADDLAPCVYRPCD